MKTSVLFGLIAMVSLAAGVALSAVFLSEGEEVAERAPAELSGPVPTVAHTLADALAQTAPALSPTPTGSLAAPVIPDAAVPSQVPFTAQAPLGQWSDSRYQDGCEEASLLMAIRWTEGKQTITNQEANQVIADMSQFELTNYGEFRDRSAADTAQLMKDYFNYQAVAVAAHVTVAEMRRELAAGNLIIVPANGRLLGNPHFTPPGPERHMVVVHGYDAARRQFITNDPGTRFGRDYRYAEATLFNAIRDYPTGYHEPIPGVQKVMIVVSPAAI